MSNVDIERSAVIRLFDNNGFDFEVIDGINHMVYESDDGFRIAFAVTWLMDDDRTYPLAQARKVMTTMLDSVKHEHAVYLKMQDKKFCEDLVDSISAFGLMYDEENDNYVYVEDDTVIFKTDLDYIVSLSVINPKESINSLLDMMRFDAKATINERANAEVSGNG